MVELEPRMIESLVLAAAFWAYFFLWAPFRALKTGVKVNDPPFSLRMKAFQVVRAAALLVMLYVAYELPLQKDLRELDWAGHLQRLAEGETLGPPMAILITLLILFAFPEMTSRDRIKRDEPPGEWCTPALTLFRWTWLGVVILAVTHFWQQLPVLEDWLGTPLEFTPSLLLPFAGALFFLIWWGLPGAAISSEADRGSPKAAEYTSRVRWVGMPAYLYYQLVLVRQAEHQDRQGEEKYCPSCMKPIQNMELFENLQFDACPHCHEPIPPVFTIEEYIYHHTERYLWLQQAREKKKKTPLRKTSRHKQEQIETDIMQRIVRATLTYALRERGTDLHLLHEGERFVIRCRTDGVLFTLLEFPQVLARTMINTIKVQCDMDITERRKPQDGSLKVRLQGTDVDVRVNTSPVPNGETASLRLLYRRQVLGSLQKLGLSPRNLRMISNALNTPHGLILVTGPTGSGKSTTLYNGLVHIANGQRNIITLEDPIEYSFDGITQMEVNPAKNFGFTSGLRTIVRQDPDVIMVGEIRDAETSKMAIDAAMTGHLVLSTLHTIDTTTTIGRLHDLGVDPERHAEALLMIVAQRLVRLNCETCIEDEELTVEDLERFGLPEAPHPFQGRRGKGCERCHETGYYDREGIYEILWADDTIRELVAAKTPTGRIRKQARKLGMRTLLEDGLTKVVLGRTTVEEVLRVTS